jgi:hypothetical protein
VQYDFRRITSVRISAHSHSHCARLVGESAIPCCGRRIGSANRARDSLPKPGVAAQTNFTRLNRRGQACLHAELFEDVLQVLLHCARADAQARPDFGIRLPARDPQQNICLAARQAEFLECD